MPSWRSRFRAVPRALFNKVDIDINFNKNIIQAVLHQKQEPGDQRPRTREQPARWVDALEEEDLAFIKRFVLASGSLKELASAYGISYPTVRLRLDRLIQKIKLVDRQDIATPFERLVRMQHADGKIDRQTLKVLLEAHQAEIARERNQ